MATALPVTAFPVNTQGLFTAIVAGSPLLNTPAVIANAATCNTNLAAVKVLITGLDPTSTDYTVDQLATFTANVTAINTAITTLSTHITHEISTAPILFSQVIAAESIQLTVTPGLGADTFMTQITQILMGGLDTVFAPINSAITPVTAAITASNPVIHSLINTLLATIPVATSAINTLVATEMAVETNVLNIINSYGSANAIVSIKNDTGFRALATAVGTSALTSHI